MWLMGFVIQGTRFTWALEMLPWFLLHQDICKNGAGHVTGVLLIDAIKNNNGPQFFNMEASLMNEHLLKLWCLSPKLLKSKTN